MGEPRKDPGYDQSCFSAWVSLRLPNGDIIQGWIPEIDDEEAFGEQLREWHSDGAEFLELRIESRDITELESWHDFVAEVLPELLQARA